MLVFGGCKISTVTLYLLELVFEFTTIIAYVFFFSGLVLVSHSFYVSIIACLVHSGLRDEPSSYGIGQCMVYPTVTMEKKQT